MVKIWIQGRKDLKLPELTHNKISAKLIALRRYLPTDFSRLPRALSDIDYWKATEVRQFLLYTSFVLKNELSKDYFNNFLCLALATRILCSIKLIARYLKYAQLLLLHFVNKFKILYGEEYIAYNIHNLIHLPNCVELFGPLDNFSAFPFENYNI